MGLKKEWADLPSKRCLNCGHRFKPTVPWQKFCRQNNDLCRKQYHEHGGAYHKLKPRIEKLVAAEAGRRARDLERKLRAEIDQLKSLVARQSEKLQSISARL